MINILFCSIFQTMYICILQKKGIEISKVAPSKLVSDFNINSSLELKKVNKPSNGEPVEKKIKLSESMNESAEGVEQIEEIDDDED